MGRAVLADPCRLARRPAAQNRHARGHDAILYLLRTDCPWCYLPRDGFPPRSTVYNIFRKFQADGTWEAIWRGLHVVLREREGREASPSTAIIDSQTIKSAAKRARKAQTSAPTRPTQLVTTPAKR